MGKVLIKEFAEICDFENGDRGKNYPSKKHYVESGIPFVSAANLKAGELDYDNLNFITEKKYINLGGGKFRQGDILFCLRGSLGKFAVVSKDIQGGIASSLIIIRCSEKINRNYLVHFLSSEICKKQIFQYDNGTAQPNLSGKNLTKFKIPLPPLLKQRAIVAKLDALFEHIDKAIALVKENIAHTEALMGSVLDEEFGRLDCAWKKLDSVTTIVGGGTPKTTIKEYWANEIVWLSPSDLPSIGEISYQDSSRKMISMKGLEKSSAKLVPKGTVCYSSRATIGKIAIAPKPLSTNQGFINFIVGDELNNVYLAYTLKHFTNKIIELSNSTTFKEVSKTAIRNFKIPVPELNVQIKMIEKCKSIDNKYEMINAKQSSTLSYLEGLKQSLLDVAFKGELV